MGQAAGSRCIGNEERGQTFQNPPDALPLLPAAASLSYPACETFMQPHSLSYSSSVGRTAYTHIAVPSSKTHTRPLHSTVLIDSQPPVFCLSGLPYSAPNLLISYSMFTRTIFLVSISFRPEGLPYQGTPSETVSPVRQSTAYPTRSR